MAVKLDRTAIITGVVTALIATALWQLIVLPTIQQGKSGNG